MPANSVLLLTPEEKAVHLQVNQDVYLLGSWCVSKEIDELQRKCSKVHLIPYPFLLEARRREAYYYCEDLAESLLTLLVPWLNQVHGTTYSIRTWRIQCGFFLVTYVQALYERFHCLQVAQTIDPNFSTTIVNSKNYKTPNNYLEFAGLVQSSDLWNHQLLSQIITHMAWFNCSKISGTHTQLKIAVNAGPGLGYREKAVFTRIKRGVVELINRFYPVAPTMFYVGGVSQLGRLRLMLRTRFSLLQMLPLGRQLALPSPLNFSLRSSMPNEGKDFFANLVLRTLRVNFPKCWLEDFSRLAQMAAGYSLKNRRPSLIITDTGWYANEVFQLWAGLSAERGSRLVGVQHGGGYGDRLINSSEIHERKCADIYISWGWKDKPNVVGLPSLKLEKSRSSIPFQKFRTRQALKIFFPSTGFPRYVGSFESSQCASQWDDYLAWQWRFIDALELKWRKLLMLRLYHWDYGRNTLQRYRSRYPDLTIIDSANHRNFTHYLHDSSLFIADNMGTTMLEALARNIPTIMFWQVDDWPSRNEVHPLYQSLGEVGVFHATPELAAKAVNGIMPKIDEWWHNSITQKSVNAYKNNFALIDDNWVKKWSEGLNQLRSW